MDNALETLFYPLESGILEPMARPFRAAFLNARPHPFLRRLGAETLFLQQYFKPYAAALQDEGFVVASEVSAQQNDFDVIFVLLPKNVTEARYIAAQAIKMIKPDGLIFCAADNKSGGTRIKKMLQQFELSNIQEESKNKARVCWGACNETNQKALNSALTEGQPQAILDGDYQSQPGIFGWNKIDKGSEILLQHLSDDLKGSGADFGCGYGYLSRSILQRCAGINSLLCIDADYRAMKLCQQNLKSVEPNVRLRFFWEDLTAPLPGHRDLDFIVMNPPFHEGKTTDSDIGKAFINTAFKSLAPGGRLYMVANVQLPYEQILQHKFSKVENLCEQDGFKVFSAKK